MIAEQLQETERARQREEEQASSVGCTSDQQGKQKALRSRAQSDLKKQAEQQRPQFEDVLRMISEQQQEAARARRRVYEQASRVAATSDQHGQQEALRQRAQSATITHA